MKNLLVLLAHLLTMIAILLGPGGARAVVADGLLMKQQLPVVNRSRRRAPDFSALDRFLFGFWSLFLNPYRIRRATVIIRPSILSKFHDVLKKRKYRLLYSFGSKGPSLGKRQLNQFGRIFTRDSQCQCTDQSGNTGAHHDNVVGSHRHWTIISHAMRTIRQAPTYAQPSDGRFSQWSDRFRHEAQAFQAPDRYSPV